MATTPSGVEQRVAEDLGERQRRGLEKYGVSVADNPLEMKEWLQHAYEETLDLVVYLKKCIEQIDRVLTVDQDMVKASREAVDAGDFVTTDEYLGDLASGINQGCNASDAAFRRLREVQGNE